MKNYETEYTCICLFYSMYSKYLLPSTNRPTNNPVIRVYPAPQVGVVMMFPSWTRFVPKSEFDYYLKKGFCETGKITNP